MIVQLTNAGQAALDANEGVVKITSFQIGSASGYIPQPTDTGIHGTSLFTGVPTDPLEVTPNIVQYSALLDTTVGPFSWGEVGLYMADGTLFALAANSTLLTKAVGDASRIDMFVSIISPNYEMWLSLVESNNPFRMAVLGAPDQLPQSQNASPNCYIITGAADDQAAFMAYTNRFGWWNFDAYDFATSASTEIAITAVSSSSVTIAHSDYDARINPTTIGDVIIEFVSGPAYSFARYVRDVVVQTDSVVIDFVSPFSIQPVVGDTLVYFVRRQSPNNVPVYPVASTTIMGIMQVGSGLKVTDGLVSVDDSVIPYPVTSFNNQTGATTFEVVDANPATGTSLVVSNGLNNTKATLRTIVAGTGIGLNLDASSNLVVTNSTPTYTLPVATTTVLGGVMAKVGSAITISASGVIDLNFTPVTSVDGQTGAVTIEAVNATGATGQTLIANSGATTGIIQLYALKAGAGTSLTLNGGDLTIAATYTLPTASTTVLGGVKVDGTTVTINASGVISANATVNVASTTVTGIVRVGSTLTLTNPATGTIDYNLPTAGVGSGGVLGGVKVDGTTVTINATTGVISASGTGVSSVNGAQGAITVQVTDANTASGTSLIVSSGSAASTTPNNPQLRRIVAGTSMANPTTDVNGNLVIGIDPTAFISGFTNANLMFNESGDLGTSNPAYRWTDSGGKAISVVSGSSNGLFWRCAPQTVAATGTITSPMFALGSRTQNISQMIMRVGADSTGTFNYQIMYYNASGTLVTTGNLSPNLPLNANLVRQTTPADTQDPTATQAQLVINYTTATWTTFDWLRGKVEAGSQNTLYSMEGTLDKIAAAAGSAVTSVSGQTGAVVVQATDTSTISGTSLISDSGATTGTIKIRRVVAGAGISLALDGNSNLQVTSTVPSYTLPVATTTVLGGVKQGTGVAIAVDGTISVTASSVTSVSGQTGTVVVQATDTSTASGTSLISDSGSTTANIRVRRIVAGTGISLALDGNSNLQINNSTPTYTLPVATTTVLGGVKQGSGVSIAGDGTLSVTAVGGVSAVSGQTGAVTVQATDNSTASGTSLIANSGATTANIKLLRLVAGTGVAFATDGNGNLQINSTASGGVTTFNTRSGAVTLTSSDITNASGALESDVVAAKYYDVPGGFAGAITPSQLLMMHVATRTINFAANFAGSQGYAGVPAAVTQTLTVAVGSTTVGTIVYSSGSQSPAFTTTGGTTLVVTPGQVLTVTAPGVADTNLSNIAFTLLGLAT